ncbi:uncharacterized protein BN578_00574 [[Clostridium] leptum CAG:27]|uniref:Uncharacterized protein n=1 Tax=[Clostridium] leptum CAG:27 TaxID=1263068 RepID=R6P540_9FIRM|nr:uncharacterized protein BN578_00574 [[Clostridium] leptum CAG:27]
MKVRPIDANKVNPNVILVFRDGHMNQKQFNSAVKTLIYSQPTIDAVPVVRCKDCKHSFERSGRKPFGCYLHGKNGITLHDGDDFCSYGERKESNE